MAQNYDVVAIGSGHNGLVAAAYLATAGKGVLVLERNAWFGGGVVTAELTGPGYLHDRFSTGHIFIQGNPLIKNDELKLLSRYGLKYIYPEIPFMVVFDDGSTIGLYRDRNKTYQEIAKFSKKDADAFLKFAEKAMLYLPMLAASLYTPPIPLGASFAMMDQSAEGRELFFLASTCPRIMDRCELHRAFRARITSSRYRDWAPMFSQASKDARSRAISFWTATASNGAAVSTN